MTFEKKVKELDNLYNNIVAESSLEELMSLYNAWLKIFRRKQKDTPERAPTEEKIAAFEKAIREFEAIYKAEKAEAEKMPLSWVEAERVREIYEEIDDCSSDAPDFRVEH